MGHRLQEMPTCLCVCGLQPRAGSAESSLQEARDGTSQKSKPVP